VSSEYEHRFGNACVLLFFPLPVLHPTPTTRTLRRLTLWWLRASHLSAPGARTRKPWRQNSILRWARILPQRPRKKIPPCSAHCPLALGSTRTERIGGPSPRGGCSQSGWAVCTSVRSPSQPPPAPLPRAWYAYEVAVWTRSRPRTINVELSTKFLFDVSFDFNFSHDIIIRSNSVPVLRCCYWRTVPCTIGRTVARRTI